MEKENVKVILIKGKYQYKNKLLINDGNIILSSGPLSILGTRNYKDLEYKDLILSKVKPGDTHFILIKT